MLYQLFFIPPPVNKHTVVCSCMPSLLFSLGSLHFKLKIPDTPTPPVHHTSPPALNRSLFCREPSRKINFPFFRHLSQPPLTQSALQPRICFSLPLGAQVRLALESHLWKWHLKFHGWLRGGPHKIGFEFLQIFEEGQAGANQYYSEPLMVSERFFFLVRATLVFMSAWHGGK